GAVIEKLKWIVVPPPRSSGVSAAVSATDGVIGVSAAALAGGGASAQSSPSGAPTRNAVMVDAARFTVNLTIHHNRAQT
ncbi:MAG TPA: hypothetical protein VMS02_05660, partial [Solirubrobacteraceae bacterium]|nr:hypothetical protein [Solirubrobacteraceae bacterium]